MLPQDVRWNSLADCLQSYLDNWSVLIKVCEEHKDDIDREIAKKVEDVNLKRNARDYLDIMKPIAVALDSCQKAACNIAECVHIWKQLQEQLAPVLDDVGRNKLRTRMDKILTPFHILAYMLHPMFFADNKLTEAEVDTAMTFVSETYPECMYLVINYRTQSAPFKPYLFTPVVVQKTSPIAWWKSAISTNPAYQNSGVIELVEALMTAICSSASIERVFSTFGLVHSKLRNRLGVDKAGKLVFIYRMLNA